LKKIISILLIGVFFTAQYARQLAYLECKLATYAVTDAVNCDCEEQTDIDRLANDGVPASKSHAHTSVDEFFSNPCNEAASATAPAVSVKPAVLYKETELNGCKNIPWRPPLV
jgi:hypothetical protein